MLGRELREDHVQDGGLPPRVQPDAARVVHDDAGDDDGDGELGARRARDGAQRGGERGDGARVRARHAAAADEPRQVPPPLLAVEGEDFQGLGDGEGREGRDEGAGVCGA